MWLCLFSQMLIHETCISCFLFPSMYAKPLNFWSFSETDFVFLLVYCPLALLVALSHSSLPWPISIFSSPIHHCHHASHSSFSSIPHLHRPFLCSSCSRLNFVFRFVVIRIVVEILQKNLRNILFSYKI